MNLPEITEVQKFRYQPGDRFILRLREGMVSQQEAEDVKRRFLAALQLPEDTPIAVLSGDWDLTITSPEPHEHEHYSPFPVPSFNGCLHCDYYTVTAEEPCICDRNCNHPNCRAS